jgi:ribosomal RNA-processing protein 8
VKHNERVTACDVRKTPLETNAVDAVVFCLALMAERVDDFIKEANRLLKTGGKLFIAEVKSRF